MLAVLYSCPQSPLPFLSCSTLLERLELFVLCVSCMSSHSVELLNADASYRLDLGWTFMLQVIYKKFKSAFSCHFGVLLDAFHCLGAV